MKRIPKIETMRADIERAKKRLMSKPIVENFGQDEVRKIADKYSDLQLDYYSDYSSLIRNFSDWCANYTGVKSSVEASGKLRPFIVTWGYDAGGPESGPKWGKGEEIQYGTSEEDACRRWEEDNHSWCNSPYSGYEGCWAKETTEEIAEEMNRKMHEEQEMLEEEVRRMFPDVYDEDITSATKSSAVKLPKEYAKYYKAYPIDEAYIEETQEVLDDYDLEYLGDAACKDKYLDVFSDNGIEYGTIARDEGGNIKVYLLAGGSVYDILGEVNIALEREW